MYKEWSELNERMQALLGKEDSFREGIETLLLLRESLMAELLALKFQLTREQFDAMPFMAITVKT